MVGIDSSIAFVVLAHKHPPQVARLARTLTADGDGIVLHVDARVAEDQFDGFRRALEANPEVRYAPRKASRWASWGLVEAAMSGIRTALEDPRAGYVAVLSGQDYPIQPVAHLRRFLDAHEGRSFFGTLALPHELYGPDGGMGRVQQPHFPVRGKRVRLPIKRPLPAGVTPYAASQFFVVRAQFASALLQEIERRTDLASYFRRSWIPDELFFATVVMNSPLASETINEHLWYAHWEPDHEHPAVITADHMPALRRAATEPTDSNGPARQKFFARKFDAAVDPTALDAVDEWLDSLRGRRGGVSI